MCLLTLLDISLGRSECLLDDEGLAAAHGVPGDDPEVVGGILLQAADLDGGLAGGDDLLPGLLANLLALHDVLLNLVKPWMGNV